MARREHGGAECLLAKRFAHGMLPTLVHPRGGAEGPAQPRDGAE